MLDDAFATGLFGPVSGDVVDDDEQLQAGDQAVTAGYGVREHLVFTQYLRRSMGK